MNPLVEFDAILIIDPWGKDWYLNEKLKEKPPWLYRRIAIEVENITQKTTDLLVNCDLHLVDDIIKNITIPLKTVTTLEGINHHIKHSNTRIEGNQNILVVGAAWQCCLHYSTLGIIGLINAGYTVWTNERLVDTDINDTTVVSEHTIMKNEGVIWKKWNDGFYEAVGINEEHPQVAEHLRKLQEL